MNRSFYSDSIPNFLQSSTDQILGALARSNEFSLELTQRESWILEIRILKEILNNYEGRIFFEHSPTNGQKD